MVYQSVHIEALAHVTPPHRVTSQALEDELAPTYQRLGIPKHCIEGLVGIVARRFWDEGTLISDVATRAARAALVGRPDLVPRLGLLISTSVSKDFVEPSVAALVHGDLGLPATCQSFDLGNACLGFLNAMDMAALSIETGRVDAALVVAAESSRHVVRATVKRLNETATHMGDFKEALPTLTLGSGAVAMLLTHERHATTSHKLHGAVTRADGAHNRICLGTAEWMKTDAQKLLTAGVDLAQTTWARATVELGWTAGGIDQFICHQVGATHMATLFKRLGLDLDRAFLTYPELGNIGPAAVPMTLGLAVDDGRVVPGARLALMGIGSGLNCSMVSVTW